MITKLTIPILFLILWPFQSDSFKNDQLKYSRVRQAYEDKEENMSSLLRNKGIDKRKMRIYLRAFKSEKQIELWGKNDSGTKYKLIKTYSVCRTSGRTGPKRKQGDSQIPEGFYHIDRFNPFSNYYLSLGINYPNKSDKILGNKRDPGDNIFIHGGCVTIGCLPITDDQIKELYIFYFILYFLLFLLFFGLRHLEWMHLAKLKIFCQAGCKYLDLEKMKGF